MIDLLKMSIKDATSLLDDDRFVFNYAYFTEDEKGPTENPRCMICLAGACLIARDLGRYDIQHVASNQIFCIDSLRKGDIYGALCQLYPIQISRSAIAYMQTTPQVWLWREKAKKISVFTDKHEMIAFLDYLNLQFVPYLESVLRPTLLKQFDFDINKPVK